MGTRTLLQCALLAVLAASPVLLRAQFKPISDEELKMTSDPKAPGAAAVYLDYEEVDNDPLHYQHIYARIKVLTEKGKELATVQLPYVSGDEKIAVIQGRTIHSDGTVVPLTVTPEDLLISTVGHTKIERKVFTLPSVEVGSILEYSYELHYSDYGFISPTWDIQGHYFVHKAHYQFLPFEEFMPNNHDQMASSRFMVDGHGNAIHSLIWWTNLPRGATLKADNLGYTLDVTDVPAAPDEEWMPPVHNYLYRVFFYYKNAWNTKEFWVNEAKLWSKDVDKFTAPTSPLDQAAAGLVSPTDSELVKAKKIYDAVQALENTDYTRAKGTTEMKALKLKAANRAEDVWKQKSGSSEDIALLYLAMVRAAGLTGYAMKVVDRNRGVFDTSYLSMNQLDSTLVLVGIDGKAALTDPGEKMCPFGTLSWKHSDAGGLRQSPSGPGYSKTPAQAYTSNTMTRIGDITVDAHGGVSGDLHFVMKGQRALRWRHIALTSDVNEVKKSFDRSLLNETPAGVEAHLDHFVGLDTPDSPLMAIIHVQGVLGTATSKRLILPGFFFEARGQEPFVDQAVRQEPVDMQYGEAITDQVTYHLPAGYAMEGAPQDGKQIWAGHAEYITKTVPSAGQITVARLLARAFDQAKPEEYKDLRDFYQKVATADQQELVLKAAPAAQGN